jgi:hypothetical protein
MANDKKFTVKNGLTTENISFVDDVTTPANTITVSMIASDALAFSGDSGQLFSITDSLTGTIFAVNDISGVPSIEVDADGVIRFAETVGNVLIGTAVDNGTDKLQINGNASATTFIGALTGNATTATTLQTARNINLGGVLSGSAAFNGSGDITITAAHTSDPVITLTGAVTGTGTMTDLGSVSIVTTATNDPILTLAGDATGTATFTNLGNATLTVAVVDDSHNHTNYVEKNVGYEWSGTGNSALSFRSLDTMTTSAGDQAALEVYQDTAGADAFMQFHVAGDFAKYFGLNGAVNDFGVGGWSAGAIFQRMFHDGYHPNADTWTTGRTITLTGGVTGTSAAFNGSGNLSISTVVANAVTADTFSTTRTDYKNVTDGAVAGQMMWKNYGNNHTIFDASAGTSPNGTGVNNANSTVPWAGTYPTLMGWNGSSTYGVRVDSARSADTLAGLGSTAASTGNTVVLRDASGDIRARLLRSEYTPTNANIGAYLTQVVAGGVNTDNYARPSTTAQVQADLGVTSAGIGTLMSQRAVGNVGTFACLRMATIDANREPGYSTAGSNLRYGSGGGQDFSIITIPGGTWELHGHLKVGAVERSSVWLRVL